MTGRPKTANDKLDAFTKTGYLSFNDEYIEPTKVMKYRDSNSNKGLTVHGQAFRPSGSNPKKIKAPYEYISDPMAATQAGTSQKNFFTAPGKKGYGSTTYGHLFSHPKYVVDPYDFPKVVDSMERKEHWGKIQSGPFFTTYPKRDHFTPNIQVYRDPPGLNSKRPQTNTENRGFKPFLRSNPPKIGYNRTINSFPQYIEEGEIENHKSPKTEGIWRHTYNGLSVPSNSVMQYNDQNRPRRKF